MKRDLRSTGPGYLDSVGEWGSRPAFELTALHPFEVDPRPNAALPTPSQDINYQRAARPKGDAIYYLVNSAPVTLGSPVMQAGDYEGQRVKLLILGADVTVQGGSASGITSDIVISAGEVAVELIWSAQNAQWVFTGGPKSATGSDVTSVFGRTGDVTAQPGDYSTSGVTNDSSVAGATCADALDQLASDIAAIPPAPVDSVNGQVGVVTLGAGDVGADPAGSAAAVQANLTAHVGDTANPHATSLANLGAGTLADLDAAVTDVALFAPTFGEMTNLADNTWATTPLAGAPVLSSWDSGSPVAAEGVVATATGWDIVEPGDYEVYANLAWITLSFTCAIGARFALNGVQAGPTGYGSALSFGATGAQSTVLKHVFTGLSAGDSIGVVAGNIFGGAATQGNPGLSAFKIKRVR